MYKCENCQKNFQSKKRNKRFSDKILKEYVWQRQTYCDLASKYNRSTKWIQRKLDETKVKKVVRINKKELVLVADVTFFTRTKGLSVFREPNLRKNVWWKQTKQENVDIYLQGKEHLEKNGFTIRAIVLDGKRGVREVFSNIPVQMCHFHQKQIVRRYLTLRPKLEASKELKQIVETLTKTTEQLFTEELSNWYNQWETFLKEKTTNPETGRWCYTHKRVRSAYRSLKTNLPYLFTYQKYPKLNIPNTTNSLDGYFNRLKSLLNVHRGLSHKRKMKLVDLILRN